MLQITDLTLAYGVNPVVRDVSLTVPAGEIFTLLGPNGAGKTSILRAVSGLLQPRSGDIRLNDVSLTGASPSAVVRHGIAHVPEGRQVFPEMSVLDNLYLGATPHIRDRATVQRLLRQNHELFPILTERADQPAGTLSGGEQQQLVIARGLMADPRLLLLDEPTLGLAPVIVEQLVALFPRLVALGLTVLIAEQNVDFALRIAASGAVMASGEIHVAGAADELRDTDDVKQAYLGG